MEREPQHHKQLLIEAVSQDYPDADKVLVSFPEDWQLVGRIKREDSAVYVASMPSSQETPRRNHFHGLPPEINETLTTYTHYKLFQPWLSPTLTVSWNETTGVGRVESVDTTNVQLKSTGQAQVWKGESVAVLWECYVFGASQENSIWREELRQFWTGVENDIGTRHVLTLPYDPAFEDGYPEFLSSLNYTADPIIPGWWRKWR